MAKLDKINPTEKIVCSYMCSIFPPGHLYEPEFSTFLIGYALIDANYKDTNMPDSYVHFSHKDMKDNLDEMVTFLKENNLVSAISLPEEFDKLWKSNDEEIQFIPELPEYENLDHTHSDVVAHYFPLKDSQKKFIYEGTNLMIDRYTNKLPEKIAVGN